MKRRRVPRESFPKNVWKGVRSARGLPLLLVLGVALGAGTVLSRQERLWFADAVPTTEWQFDRPGDGLDPLAGLTLIDRGRNQSSVTLGPDGLSHGNPTADNAATYLQHAFDGPVSRIGATVDFGSSDTLRTGSAALLIAFSALPNEPARFDPGIPDMGMHFVFDAQTWSVGVWESGAGLQVLGTGQFSPRLTGERSVDIVRAASEATVHLPDGTTRMFDDPRISSWSGPWAAWELFEQHVSYRPVAFTRIWGA